MAEMTNKIIIDTGSEETEIACGLCGEFLMGPGDTECEACGAFIHPEMEDVVMTWEELNDNFS